MKSHATIRKHNEHKTGAAGKTQYVKGALWDIGIVFRRSLYHFTVFGACTYDTVQQQSEICIKLQLSVLMIVGSYNGVLAQCKPCVADVTRSLLTRPQLEHCTRQAMWDRMDLRAFMSQKGIATGIATGIALGLARPWKKGTISRSPQT